MKNIFKQSVNLLISNPGFVVVWLLINVFLIQLPKIISTDQVLWAGPILTGPITFIIIIFGIYLTVGLIRVISDVIQGDSWIISDVLKKGRGCFLPYIIVFILSSITTMIIQWPVNFFAIILLSHHHPLVEISTELLISSLFNSIRFLLSVYVFAFMLVYKIFSFQTGLAGIQRILKNYKQCLVFILVLLTGSSLFSVAQEFGIRHHLMHEDTRKVVQ